MSGMQTLELTGYSRLPEALEKRCPNLSAGQKYDKYGAADRLKAIKFVLGDRNLGFTIDLGGNAGYFCLSLLDAGTLSKAIVYDLSRKALQAGRIMSQLMELEDKIKFVEQAISLDMLPTLPCANTIFCLNLLHHAGSEFDVETVRELGWRTYASQFLGELWNKADCLVLGMKFELNRPRFWDVPHPDRVSGLLDIATSVGWKLLYEANVRDIEILGVEAANGLYTTGGRKLDIRSHRFRVLFRKLSSTLGLTIAQRALNRRHKYHILIFEHDK
jgi:hypothetical protein